MVARWSGRAAAAIPLASCGLDAAAAVPARPPLLLTSDRPASTPFNGLSSERWLPPGIPGCRRCERARAPPAAFLTLPWTAAASDATARAEAAAAEAEDEEEELTAADDKPDARPAVESGGREGKNSPPPACSPKLGPSVGGGVELLGGNPRRSSPFTTGLLGLALLALLKEDEFDIADAIEECEALRGKMPTKASALPPQASPPPLRLLLLLLLLELSDAPFPPASPTLLSEVALLTTLPLPISLPALERWGELASTGADTEALAAFAVGEVAADAAAAAAAATAGGTYEPGASKKATGSEAPVK